MSITSTRPSASTQNVIPKPTVDIDKSVIIADKAVLSGSCAIRIGRDSVVQPYAKILAIGQDVAIGARCIIAEAAILEAPEGSQNGLNLADGVSVESGATITAASIGESTEIGIQSRIDTGAVIGKVRQTFSVRVDDLWLTEYSSARLLPNNTLKPVSRFQITL